jgi:hypothetical protein
MCPASVSQPQILSEALIGTWELLSRVDRTAAGERRIEPGLGEDPVAVLYYDQTGRFAAQFMKRDRRVDASVLSGAAAATTGVRAPNNSRAQGEPVTRTLVWRRACSLSEPRLPK